MDAQVWLPALRVVNVVMGMLTGLDIMFKFSNRTLRDKILAYVAVFMVCAITSFILAYNAL